MKHLILFILFSVIVSCAGPAQEVVPFIAAPGTNGTIIAYNGKQFIFHAPNFTIITNIRIVDPMIYTPIEGGKPVFAAIVDYKAMTFDFSGSSIQWTKVAEGVRLFMDVRYLYVQSGNKVQFLKDYAADGYFTMPDKIVTGQYWAGKFLAGFEGNLLTVYEFADTPDSVKSFSAKLPEAVIFAVHPNAPYLYFIDKNDRIFSYHLYSKESKFIDAPPFKVMRIEILAADNSLMVYGADKVFIYRNCDKQNIRGMQIDPLDIAVNPMLDEYYYLYPDRIEVWSIPEQIKVKTIEIGK
ncbi:MAG: hypothetical protein A2Y33_14695 [Spirochaetes bacterium GWF1_51_8]|nr:MAG: hypothetical protein A2Y33_14695 [Spirochaetes bacterium GWF1_51_8]